MEYGDAINSESMDVAVDLVRRFRKERRQLPLATLAAEAVARAYCVCVTAGEDAAERRLSDVHRKLIADVVDRVRRFDDRF